MSEQSTAFTQITAEEFVLMFLRQLTDFDFKFSIWLECIPFAVA